jgi:uncharacterized protein with PIN domain
LLVSTRRQVATRLPPGERERYERFADCDGCARVFWEGTHWRHMRDLFDAPLVRAS